MISLGDAVKMRSAALKPITELLDCYIFHDLPFKRGVALAASHLCGRIFEVTGTISKRLFVPVELDVL